MLIMELQPGHDVHRQKRLSFTERAVKCRLQNNRSIIRCYFLPDGSVLISADKLTKNKNEKHIDVDLKCHGCRGNNKLQLQQREK